MEIIRSITAYYPAFHLGFRPSAVECTLSIVQVNGKRYLKTPFAMLDAFADDDCERQIGRGYYATADDCMAYLRSEYPWAAQAEPLMDRLFSAIHHYGDLVGAGRVADKCCVSTDAVYKLARGHRSFTLKQVRAAIKAIGQPPVIV